MSNTIQSKPLATTPLSTDDILAIVQGGVLKRTTVGSLPQGVTVVTNSNGSAIRFPSTFQICISQELTTGGNTAAANGAFISDSVERVTWTFPAAFSTAPLHIVGTRQLASSTTVKSISSTTTAAVIASVEDESQAADREDIYMIAVGFWA